MTEKIAMRALYAMNFLLSMHVALVVFFNSSLLASRGVADAHVGLVYVLGSVANLIILFFASYILRRFGNYKTVIYAAIVQFLLYLGIAFFDGLASTVVLFALSLATVTFLFFAFDILLESYTKSEDGTGETRSLLLTAINTAFVISPLIAGYLLHDDEFTLIYVVAALLIIPVLWTMRRYFKDFKDPQYHKLSPTRMLKMVSKNKDIRGIFFIHFLLRFFYATMTIYMPLYLVKIGFSLASIGIMFTIMLLPFIFLEYPLGKFADKYWGEKELLTIGFIILVITTAIIPMLTVAEMLMWAGVLFATRVGAATVEVMNEIYFFKHVDGDDTDTISAYRMIRPVAYILGPGLGSLILYFSDMRTIFIFLAIIFLSGIYASIRLRDTK